jgi:hypothetical protein
VPAHQLDELLSEPLQEEPLSEPPHEEPLSDEPHDHPLSDELLPWSWDELWWCPELWWCRELWSGVPLSLVAPPSHDQLLPASPDVRRRRPGCPADSRRATRMKNTTPATTANIPTIGTSLG